MKKKRMIALLLCVGLIVSTLAGCRKFGEDGDSESDERGTVAADAQTESQNGSVIYDVEDFAPHAVESTKPERLIKSTAVSVDGKEVKKYASPYRLKFYEGTKYSANEGIVTFRGDNFRSGAAYGTAEVSEGKLNTVWSNETGKLADADGIIWSGNGWTGQPLITKWSDSVRRNITAMYDWARQKDGLVEVIYASLDGYIYFYELDTGEATRPAMFVGYTFKGAGALDPRGYPIMYVGSGVDSANGKSHVFVINLVNNSIMYEFGQTDSFCDRNWGGFDSSALVCAQTDQLIYPGENGILYIIHLNTNFDETTGELSINPDNVVKWKYMGTRTGKAYWLGMEDSAIIVNHYMIIADNGGLLMCLDLASLELVWVQDVLDDTNCTPVLSIENGKPYVYISTSFHYGWRGTENVTIPVWKINAETGEIVWQTDFSCKTIEDVSGGVQGTIAVGKNKLDKMIFVPVARTPDLYTGELVALNKEDGSVVWEKTGAYSWSSPVDFYDTDGNGYLIYCNSAGSMCLLDGLTGNELDYVSLGSNIEASAAMYNDRVVVGTRGQMIYCVQVS